jgi:alpha-beta hydrolase superfamily lysophospholipase
MGVTAGSSSLSSWLVLKAGERRGFVLGGLRVRLPLLFCFLLVVSACLPADWGARAILCPVRRPLLKHPDLGHEDVSFESDGVVLRGWIFRAQPPRRGLLVYLHGIADNRQSGLGVARRFIAKGYDVLLYDSRAHGTSGGTFCSYGYHEKRDLVRALNQAHALRSEAVILMGHSLGAAVALQAAAIEPRVRGVIAVSSFSDLETIVNDRKPWFATRGDVTAALALAARRGDFAAESVSPERAAARIHVPVLLVHGERDRATRPVHSKRIYAALAEPKELILVKGGGHNDVLGREQAWRAIESWLKRYFERTEYVAKLPPGRHLTENGLGCVGWRPRFLQLFAGGRKEAAGLFQ